MTTDPFIVYSSNLFAIVSLRCELLLSPRTLPKLGGALSVPWWSSRPCVIVTFTVCCGCAICRQSVELHSSAELQSAVRFCGDHNVGTALPQQGCGHRAGLCRCVLASAPAVSSLPSSDIWLQTPESTKIFACLLATLDMPCVLLRQVSVPKPTDSRAPNGRVLSLAGPCGAGFLMILNNQRPACRRKNDRRVHRRGHQHAAQPRHCCQRAGGGRRPQPVAPRGGIP